MLLEASNRHVYMYKVRGDIGHILICNLYI